LIARRSSIAITFGDLAQRQGQIEHLSRIHLALQNTVNQVGQVTPHWRRTAKQPHMPEEEIRRIEFDAVREADVADGPARARHADSG
jgi:hypothetical protein